MLCSLNVVYIHLKDGTVSFVWKEFLKRQFEIVMYDGLKSIVTSP